MLLAAWVAFASVLNFEIWPLNGFFAALWPEDPEAVGTLQEIFGYCLTADVSQQKGFLLVGPKRSGKGTIARVLTRLVGMDNTVAPTLAGLGMNFGLAPLIGKRVAIISDARLGGRADQHAIAERLLSITGEDAITIDRKFREAWTGRLQTPSVSAPPSFPPPGGGGAGRVALIRQWVAAWGSNAASRIAAMPITEAMCVAEGVHLRIGTVSTCVEKGTAI